MKMTIRGIKEKIRETLKMVRMAQLEFRSWVHNSKNHAVVLLSKLKLWHVLDLLDHYHHSSVNYAFQVTLW